MRRPHHNDWKAERTIYAIAAVMSICVAARADGPGAPNLTYPSNQVFQIIATLGAPEIPYFHGTAVMHNGYLVIPFSAEVSNGGFAFLDISNPYQPQIVHTLLNADTREGHSIGFHYTNATRYAVTQGSFGIHFWDWTDVTQPVMVSNLPLPGIEASDYANAAWWLFWQAPYVYVGGASQGLYVVDASNPASPVLANHLPISQTGGFPVGAVFAVGNLLVLAMNDGFGLATMNIGDPIHPALLDVDNSRTQYSIMVNGGRAYLAGTEPMYGLHVFDLANPSQLTLIGTQPFSDRGGYIMTQDGFAHIGVSSTGYYMIDARTLPFAIVGGGDFTEPLADVDFVSSIGNLTVLGDDDGYGTRFMPHQSAPDTTPPAVNMIHPPANAVSQPLTTRVGVTWSDQIDLRTVNETSFSVSRIGEPPLAGRYSGQTGVTSFCPAAPLEPNATYVVRVPAGGVRDLAGNATSVGYLSYFSTGPAIEPIVCDAIAPRPPSPVGMVVSFEASCAGVNLLYSWDFGDNSPPTPPVSTADATHVYSSPGHYVVLLTVSNDDASRTVSTTQTVYVPPTASRPTVTSTIVEDEPRNRVWLVNSDAGTVAAFDAICLQKLFEPGVGHEPATLAVAQNGRIWVVNQGDATISILDGNNGVLIDTLALPYASRPFGVVFSPTGSAAYVSFEATGKLLKLDAATGALLSEAQVGPTPRGVSVTHDGSRVLVTRFNSPVDHGVVTEVDPVSMTVVRQFNLAADAGPDTEASGRGIPNYIFSATISPDGQRAWVPSKKDNTLRGAYRDGLPLTFETTVRAIVSQIDLVGNSEDLGARRDLNNRSLPSAVAFSPLGDYAFVPTLGSNSVDVLDVYSGALVSSIENVGLAPRGILVTAGMRLFIHNDLSRTLAVYDVSGVGIDSAFPLIGVRSIVAVEPLPAPILNGKRIFFNAADTRMSRDHYLSCAACHLDGDSDGRVWDFTDRGEGLRKTIPLLGRAGMRHGPVHWTANFDEIQDFEGDIRSAFAGTGLMSDAAFFAGTRSQPLGDPKAGLSADLDDLAAYVSSLARTHTSPFRIPNGGLMADALAGAALFRSPAVGCSACHRDCKLTDSELTAQPYTLHDVGTIGPGSGMRLGQPLTGLDTPTLNGIWENPPYLHNGSAATLLDVLTTANPGNLHGNTSQLSAAQRMQLVAYLLSLDAPMTVESGGDIDGDGDVDAVDMQNFVNVLLDTPIDVSHRLRADLNGDGCTNGEDIAPFVAAML